MKLTTQSLCWIIRLVLGPTARSNSDRGINKAYNGVRLVVAVRHSHGSAYPARIYFHVVVSKYGELVSAFPTRLLLILRFTLILFCSTVTILLGSKHEHCADMQIPLGPQDVAVIQQKLSSIPFSQATSSWPNRFIRENAREIFNQSVSSHMRMMGWEWNAREGKLMSM